MIAMKKIISLSGMFLAMLGLSAQAADLRVRGSIAPASCSFTIVNSTIDYGRIDPRSLSATNYTKLAKKGTPYTVRCASPTFVGIKAQDNRASSKVRGMMVSQYNITYNDDFNYGLGFTSKNEKIGGYVVFMENNIADGKAVRAARSNNNGASWGITDPVLGQSANVGSWRTSASYSPIKITVVSGNLNVQPVINKTSALSMNNEIKLDGHTTLELVYL